MRKTVAMTALMGLLAQPLIGAGAFAQTGVQQQTDQYMIYQQTDQMVGPQQPLAYPTDVQVVPVQPVIVGQPVAGGVVQEEVIEEPTQAQEVLLLPVRLVTGAVGAPIGAIGGMAQRTGDAVEMVNNATFRQVVGANENMTDNPGRTFGRGIVLVPVGVVSTAAALPVGVAVGAVEGTFRGFARGFQFPNMEQEAALGEQTVYVPVTEGQAAVQMIPPTEQGEIQVRQYMPQPTLRVPAEEVR